MSTRVDRVTGDSSPCDNAPFDNDRTDSAPIIESSEHDRLRIYLAPMEGVVDAPMRLIQAKIGGPDRMVTEFIRVTDQRLPKRVFTRSVPELNQADCGYGSIPLVVQLLGSDPQALATNALRAIELGAPGIDLNFGCPAKTVNRSKGGAVMLEDPESVFRAVDAVRRAVPKEIPVSAKMRLGYLDKSKAVENAQAIEHAAASFVTVHARTKLEGYKPPAHWEWIGRIREAVKIPVVANGEIWTPEDYWRCRELSGCDEVMIGRGLIANPFLAEQIRKSGQERGAEADTESTTESNWLRLQPFFDLFIESVEAKMEDQFVPGRIKQWLSMLSWHFPQAKALFTQIRKESELKTIKRKIRESRSDNPAALSERLAVSSSH